MVTRERRQPIVVFVLLFLLPPLLALEDSISTGSKSNPTRRFLKKTSPSVLNNEVPAHDPATPHLSRFIAASEPLEDVAATNLLPFSIFLRPDEQAGDALAEEIRLSLTKYLFDATLKLIPALLELTLLTSGYSNSDPPSPNGESRTRLDERMILSYTGEALFRDPENTGRPYFLALLHEVQTNILEDQDALEGFLQKTLGSDLFIEGIGISPEPSDSGESQGEEKDVENNESLEFDYTRVIDRDETSDYDRLLLLIAAGAAGVAVILLTTAVIMFRNRVRKSTIEAQEFKEKQRRSSLQDTSTIQDFAECGKNNNEPQFMGCKTMEGGNGSIEDTNDRKIEEQNRQHNLQAENHGNRGGFNNVQRVSSYPETVGHLSNSLRNHVQSTRQLEIARSSRYPYSDRFSPTSPRKDELGARKKSPTYIGGSIPDESDQESVPTNPTDRATSSAWTSPKFIQQDPGALSDISFDATASQSNGNSFEMKTLTPLSSHSDSRRRTSASPGSSEKILQLRRRYEAAQEEFRRKLSTQNKSPLHLVERDIMHRHVPESRSSVPTTSNVQPTSRTNSWFHDEQVAKVYSSPKELKSSGDRGRIDSSNKENEDWKTILAQKFREANYAVEI